MTSISDSIADSSIDRVVTGVGTVNVPGTGSVSTNPHTLTGTAITEIGTDALAFAARIARKAEAQENVLELWYWRDSTWSLFPNGPLTDPSRCPHLRWEYRQPSTLSFVCENPVGEFTPENMASPWNLNGDGHYDPLFDEARKVLFRVGAKCYNNLAFGITPTASVAPFSGALSQLTNGTFQNFASTLSQVVIWNQATSAAFDVVFDLGTSQKIRHAGLRFGTLLGSLWLPVSVQLLVSNDGTNYVGELPHPVGGQGGGTTPPGDWDDDPNGRAVEIAFTDLDVTARYVKFHVVPTGTTNQPIGIDEIAIFGGDSFQILGKNMFLGYLGDNIETNNAGTISCVATDSFKRLNDNNEAQMTAPFYNAELADISWALFTGGTYWPNQGEYSAPFTNAEIGWANGSALTGLTYPVWQQQNNNMMGYQMDLWHSVGWVLYSDGNGVWQAFDPPYKQKLPDRVFTNADNGNRDVRNIVRQRTGKDLRNVADVRCGLVAAGASGRNQKSEPNSVVRYGPRRVVINDPVLQTDALREKVANYVLRDYAYRLSSVTATIQPDFDIRIKAIHGFRAPFRPSMFSKGSSSSGYLRSRELWTMTGLEQRFTAGQWDGQATYVPYYPAVVDPPILTKLEAPSGVSQLVVYYSPQSGWTNYTQPSSYNLYYSTTSENGPWTLYSHPAVSNAPATTTITGITSGTQYWVYMSSVDSFGYESLPSEILSVTGGSGVPDNVDGWTVTDLAASLSQSSGPDSQGYYTYAFYCTWTSPSPKGYKRMTIRMSYNSLPSVNADWWSSWPLADNSWNEGNAGHIVPPGLTWDRQTAGQLFWICRLRTKTHLTSGSHMYIKMWTSSTNLGFHPGNNAPRWWGYPSNVATVNL